jgi:hypothetical protein
MGLDFGYFISDIVVMKLLILAALVLVPCFAENTPTCKTSWPVKVCYTVSQSPTSSRVTIGVTALESQSEYLPITGYVVNARVRLEDGSFAPFQLTISRDNWDGENSATFALPSSSIVIGVPHLTVTVRRNSESVIVY